MKIKRIEIDGFGKLVNKSYDLFSYSVFLGENEAGKSTILSFIKYMIFGFENKTKSNRDFFPLNSKIYGGRITVEIDGETIVLERIKTKRTGPASFSSLTKSGKALTEEEWQGLISPMTPDLFDQIYTVSQDNLQVSREKDYDADSLDEKWRMAASSGSLELYDELNAINKEKTSLYTSSKAMSKPLNSLLVEIEEVKQAIKEKQLSEEEIAPLIRQTEQRQREIDKYKDAINVCFKDVQFLEKQASYFPEYKEYQALKAVLSSKGEAYKDLDLLDFEQSYIQYEELQKDYSFINKQIEDYNEQFQVHMNPKTSFLLKEESQDTINNLFEMYSYVKAAEADSKKSVFGKNILLTFIPGLILLMPTFIISGTMQKIILGLALIALLVASMFTFRVYKLGKDNVKQANDYLDDFDSLLSYFDDWYPVHKANVDEKYSLIRQIDLDIKNLESMLYKLDTTQLEEERELISANITDLKIEVPNIEDIPNLLAEVRDYRLREERFLRLDDILSSIFDLYKTDYDLDYIKEDINNLEGKIQSIDAEMTALIDQNSMIFAKIESKKNDDSLDLLQENLEVLRTKLSEVIHKYLLKASQAKIIENIMANLATDSLPEILRKASLYFEQLSAGKWKNILLENDILVVEDRSGQKLRLLDLSTATKDQLQLAIRLAFIDSKNTGFPIFFDDSFMRYDRKRRKSFMKILEDISQREQVIMFTSDEGILQKDEGIVKV